MKKIIISLSLLGCLAASQVFGQTGGASGQTGGAGASPGSGSSAGAGASSGTSGANAGAGANVAVPPTREPLPPAVGQTPVTPGTTPGVGVGVGAQGANGSVNAGAGISQNPNAVNGGGTNLTPASRPETGTNRIYWTNRFGSNRFGTNMHSTNSITGTNGSGLGPQDVALTEFDRTLIIRIRTTIIQRLGGTPAVWAPVSFNADNGIVTIAGVVPSLVLKQR